MNGQEEQEEDESVEYNSIKPYLREWKEEVDDNESSDNRPECNH